MRGSRMRMPHAVYIALFSFPVPQQGCHQATVAPIARGCEALDCVPVNTRPHSATKAAALTRVSPAFGAYVTDLPNEWDYGIE